MATFERVDLDGDLNSGNLFFITDHDGEQVELSQEEAKQLMRWLRSFLEPLPSLAQSELIDHVELDKSQEADIHSGGEVWIHDNATRQDIKLDAKAATLLFDFLLLHQDRLTRHRDAAAKIRAYNAEMDARNRIIAENREKPWLPLQPSE